MTSAPLRVPSPNLEDPETASLFGERASYGTVDGVGSGKLKQLGRTESDLRRQRRNSDSEQQWRKFSTRLRYYVPVFAWLPSYSSSVLPAARASANPLKCILDDTAVSVEISRPPSPSRA